ncbi:hypothetical protein ACFPOU_17055 [Massilia jejuensis]|uniref:Uncharacterized protein n=1 Tax=Massilia jejuensis TaxID=648894 RepID=A0ABW0PQT0_9BURK
MSETEKNEAHERRKKAAEAAANEPVVIPTCLATPIWPSPMSIMRWEAHGTPIPPPPEGYKGQIPERYAAHIAWPAGAGAPSDAVEGEEQEEEAVDAPGM